MASLLIFDHGTRESVGVGVFLFLIGAVMTWTMFRVPLWIAVTRDSMLVRYLLGMRSFDLNDIAQVASGSMTSTIGFGARHYPTLKIALKNGKAIKVLLNERIMAALQSRCRNIDRNLNQ
jgi:hypothetical protein